MNYIVWAEDINDSHARVLKARYYGEITYIDHCIGRILDAVEARGDADNTLICFFADHGDLWATTTPGRRRASSRPPAAFPSW